MECLENINETMDERDEFINHECRQRYDTTLISEGDISCSVSQQSPPFKRRSSTPTPVPSHQNLHATSMCEHFTNQTLRPRFVSSLLYYLRYYPPI